MTRRALRRLAIVLLALAVPVTGLWLARAPIAVRVLPWLAAREGLELSIGDVRGSWTRDLELVDVRFAGRERIPEVPSLAVARARADLAWRDLVRGRLEGLLRVEADVTELVLDFTAPSEDDDAGGGGVELPERLPELALDLRSLTVRLGPERGLAAQGLAGSLADDPAGGQRLRLGAVLELREPTVGTRAHRVDLDARWRSRALTVDAFSIDGEDAVRTARVDLDGLARGDVAWEVALALGGGEIDTTGRVAGGAVDARVDGRSIDPAPLAALHPAAAELGLGGRIETLALDVDRPAGGAPVARGTVSWSEPRVAGYEATRFRADVELLADTAVVHALELDRGANRVTARALGAPLDALFGGDPVALLRALDGRVVAELRDLADLAATDAVREQLTGLGPHRLTLSARAAGGRLELETGRIEVTSGFADIVRGSLELPPDGALARARLDLELEADFGDAALAAAGFDDDVDGWFHGTLELAGPLDALVGQARFEGSEVDLLGLPLGTVELVASVDEDAADVASLRVDGGLGTLEARGRLLRDGLRLEDATLSAEVPDLARFGVAGLGGGPASVEGRLAGPVEAPFGQLVLSAAALTWREQALEDVQLSGRLTWPKLECDRVAAASDLGSLAARATVGWDARSVRVDLEDVLLTRGDVDVELVGPAAVVVAGDGLEAGPIELGGTAGRCVAHVREVGGAWTITADLERFEPMVLLGPLAPPGVELDAVDGRVDVRVAGDETAGSARLDLHGLRVGTDPTAGWTANLDLALEPGRARVRELVATHAEGDRATLTADLPFDPLADPPLLAGDVRVDARVARLDLARWVSERLATHGSMEGTFGGHVALSGSWRALTGEGQLVADDFLLDLVSDDDVPSFGPTRLALSAEVTEAGLALTGTMDAGDARRPAARAEVRSGWRPDAVALLEDRGRALLDAPVDGDAELVWPDLLDARRLVPAMPRATGSCRVAARVTGTLAAPDLRGELAVDDGSLRGLGDFPGVANLGVLVRFDGDRLAIERCAGELGGAPARLEGGARLAEGGLELDLRLVGENALLLRSRGFRLRADADLSVKGPLPALTVTGTATLTDGKYARNFDPLAGLGESSPRLARARGVYFPLARSGPLADARLDVAVRARDPLVVKTSLLRGELRPDLRLVGTGRVPELHGRIYVDSGRLLVPAGRVEVRAGAVFFREDDPFVPELELSADARIRGYEVTASVTGDYDRPEVVLSSVPPLPSEDLLSLVLTGQLSGEVRTDRSAAAETVAVYLARDYLRRWMSDDEIADAESFVDRFDYQTGVDPTQTGVETQLGSFRLNPDGQAATRHYLVVERDAYEKYNFGYRILFRFR